MAANKLTIPIALIALYFLVQPRANESLRTGAPALACINLRPFHGLNRPKPASASQFFLEQSSLTYAPGQNVTVVIGTDSSERNFKGFIIQAYDPSSGSQIGHFLPTLESRPIDSCSAATHRNNSNKKRISLTWLPSSTLEEPANQAAANQWLSGFQIQPTLSYRVSQKRQQAGGAADSNTTLPLASQPVASGAAAEGSRQVRFRATIVVTYEEFYTGFESSDRQFEKFDYATTTTSSPPKPARK